MRRTQSDILHDAVESLVAADVDLAAARARIAELKAREAEVAP